MSICRSLEKHEASSLVFLIRYTVVHKLWVRNRGKDTLKLRENQQRFLPQQWKSAYYWSTFYTISSILQGFTSPNNFNVFLSDKGIYVAIKWENIYLYQCFLIKHRIFKYTVQALVISNCTFIFQIHKNLEINLLTSKIPVLGRVLYHHVCSVPSIVQTQ